VNNLIRLILTFSSGESESLPVLLRGVVHGQLGLLTKVASEANHVEIFLQKAKEIVGQSFFSDNQF